MWLVLKLCYLFSARKLFTYNRSDKVWQIILFYKYVNTKNISLFQGVYGKVKIFQAGIKAKAK